MENLEDWCSRSALKTCVLMQRPELRPVLMEVVYTCISGHPYHPEGTCPLKYTDDLLLQFCGLQICVSRGAHFEKI